MRTLKLILLAMCFYLELSAQKIKAIEIGEQVPDLQFSQVLNSQVPVRLSDFNGKALVLDLWGTWCGACLSSMPYLDSLQRHFKDDLMVLCITKENEHLVKEVTKKVFLDHRPSLTIVTGDTVIEKYFPHRSFPHYIWIAKNGTVMAITDKAELSDEKIKDLIQGTTLHVRNKPKSIRFNTDKPPYASKEVRLEDEFLFHSQVTAYREDLRTTYNRGIRNDFVSCLNSPITRLYQMAFGHFAMDWLDMNRIVLIGFHSFADSASIGLFTTKKLNDAWLGEIQKNAYSYEFATRDTIFSKVQLFRIMQEDLNRYFGTMGIEGHVEKRPAKLIALVQVGGNTRYKSVGESKAMHYSGKGFLKIDHEPISFFLTQLMPDLHVPGYALINETGYKGRVSVELNKLDGIEDLNKELLPYGLALQERAGTADMVVITKTK